QARRIYAYQRRKERTRCGNKTEHSFARAMPEAARARGSDLAIDSGLAAHEMVQISRNGTSEGRRDAFANAPRTGSRSA
ncbi:MAG: hypothetical protein JRM97_09140, partial [Nitrososphaerota archaeon]|nr:hypothetical protein [Nitrososphaerota archaeon]